jgi:thiol-disulfide isomerase/thioredoxin
MKIINKAVMTLTGVVLIVAAALKVDMMVSEPVVSKGFWESWLFFMIQIPLVTGLGIWMISGLFRKAAWLAGVAALFVFLIDTLYKAFSGAQSCGCFGSVEVDPWVTLFAFNLPFLAAMLIFRPKDEKLLPPPWPNPVYWGFVGVITAAALATITTFMAFNRIEPKIVDLTGTLHANQDNVSNPEEAEQLKQDDTQTNQNSDVQQSGPQKAPAESKTIQTKEQVAQMQEQTNDNAESSKQKSDTDTVENDTEKASGQTDDSKTDQTAQKQENQNAEKTASASEQKVEPVTLDAEKRAVINEMLSHVDIIEKLNNGLAVAFFYHDSCPTCADLVPQYSAGLDQFGENVINLAFIDIPGKASAPDPVPEDTLAYTGQLQPRQKGQKWVVGTPLIVVLMDAEVQLAWQLQAPSFDEMLDAAFSQ